jgi:O-antigen/teichoic acid export membrane protein
MSVLRQSGVSSARRLKLHEWRFPLPPQSIGWQTMDALGRTSAALAVNTVVTAAFGVVFWVAASHHYSPRQVGIDSALISSMLLISSFTELNFSTALPRLLPLVNRRRSQIVAFCYLSTAAIGAVVAVVFAFAVAAHFANLRFLASDNDLAFGLVIAVIVFNVFAVQDAVLVAMHRAAVVPVENAIFGVLKIAIMLALIGRMSGHGIFLAWVAGAALLVVPVSIYLFGTVLRSAPPSTVESTYLPVEGRGAIVRYLGQDWIASLLGQGTADLLPLLVLASLGRSATAYFFVSFMIATAAFMFAQSFCTALLVEGSHDEAALAVLARRSAIRCTVVGLPALVVAVIIAPEVLRVFGGSYAAHGTEVLRLMLIAVIPQIAVGLVMAVQRVRGRAGWVLKVQFAVACIAIGLALPCMRSWGLAGIGWAWLAAQSVAFFLAVPTLTDILSGTGRADAVQAGSV